MKNTIVSRRQFVRTSAAAAGSVAFASLAPAAVFGANERIRIGVIGCGGQGARPHVERAVHHYFAYRVELNRLEFRHLMQDGRRTLLIGLVFLAACLSLSKLLAGAGGGTFSILARESLAIAGWVAMWRPMEIYLYDWWPLRRREKILRKLSAMAVEVRKRK